MDPFYMPSPGLFGRADAYQLFTSYASQLEEAGLRGRFPSEADLRHCVIEHLAERYVVEDVRANPWMIDDAIAECRALAANLKNEGS